MLNRLILTNLFYFKSNWADIRAAAPMFIGKAAGVLLPNCSSGFAWVSSPPQGAWPPCPGDAFGPCSAGRALHEQGCWKQPGQLVPPCAAEHRPAPGCARPGDRRV